MRQRSSSAAPGRPTPPLDERRPPSVARLAPVLALLLAVALVPGEPAHAVDCGEGTGDVTGTCGPETAIDPGSASPPFRPRSTLGNPVQLITGNKYQRETDVEAMGSALAFHRHYNSANGDHDLGFGHGWSTSYTVSLFRSGGSDEAPASLEILQSDGRRLRFTDVSVDASGRRVYRSASTADGRVHWQGSGGGRSLWHLPDGRTLAFQGSFLVRIDWPGERALSLYYAKRRLARVTDETGRVLGLEWTRGRTGLGRYGDDGLQSLPGHLAALVLPDGSRVEYAYDAHRNLARARFADGTERRYHYEDPLHPNHLTGLTDRTGVRFASWGYDESGLATSSEHADGTERLDIAYERPTSEDGSGRGTTTVTDALGDVSIYTWDWDAASGTGRLLSGDGAGCTTCPPTGRRYTYTPDGRLASRTTVGGNTRRYVHDEHGRLAEITEEAPDGKTRLIERREYANSSANTPSGDTAGVDGTPRSGNDGLDVRANPGHAALPARVVRRSVRPDGEHVVEIARDAAGRPLELVERGFSPVVPDGTDARDIGRLLESGTLDWTPISRTTRFVHEGERLVAVDGPRDDIDDVTRFEHDARGRLVALLLPGRPAVRVERFDALDRPVVVRVGTRSPFELEYDAGNRLVRLTRLGQTVRFGHDAEGRERFVTDTNGRTTWFEHDAAGRPSALIDDLGRRTEYTRDAESRLVGVRELGLDGTVIRAMTRTLDAAGHVATLDEDGLAFADESRRTVFERDPSGRLLGASDSADGARIGFERDAFGTPLALVEPSANGEIATRIVPDARGNPVGLVDPRGNATWRLVDDFGRTVVDATADTGVVRVVHDAAGHPLERRDAAGRTTRYRWDAAGRLVERLTPDDTARYTWDDATGLLLAATDDATRETFAHDVEGRLVEHAREIDGHRFVTRYTYDGAGRVATKTLPDGEVLGYHYREDGPARGTLRAITRRALFGFRQETLVAEIDLDARDGRAGYVSANGIRTDYRHRADGAVETLEIGQGLRLDYRYDAAGRIVGIDRDGLSRRIAWEGGRLTLAETATGRHVYRYDAAGNRTARESTRPDGRLERERLDYPAPGSGNRLLARTDETTGETTDYRWTPGGATSAIGTEYTLDTDADERPVRVYRHGVLLAEYRYNAFGERVKKVVHGSGPTPTITYFLYDGSTLTAEIDATGEPVAQYVYLDGHRPVARLAHGEVHAIHADPLGTPRTMTDAAGATVWAAEYDPFGAATTTIERVPLPLRLPGQYADAETGTHYNYHRDYDPALGRYRSSDPLGRDGGANAYAYADGNPLQLADALGLSTDPSLTAGAVAKPEADFGSKLDYVVALTIERFKAHGLEDVATETLNALKETAVVLAGVAAVVGVVVGGAAVLTGGAALPVAAGALASATSALGVVALWTAGIQGVMLIYDIIKIGLGVYEAEHTDCARLDDLSEQLYRRLVRAGGEVMADVASIGLGKIAGKLQDVFRAPRQVGRCSFHGDTLVLTRSGRRQIREIDPDRDLVWSKDELTGVSAWKRIRGKYSNPYESTVHVTSRDRAGNSQTIVSNRIHPFFARVAVGAALVVASEGHVYAGPIDGGAWVDAQHLETGHELLGSEGDWQTVVNVEITDEPLQAFNLSVEDYSTYFVSAAASTDPVWVHNVCYPELPKHFERLDEKTEYGHIQYRGPAPDYQVLYRAYDSKSEAYRYYVKNDHPPTAPHPLPDVNKAVNTGMNHAVDRAILREIFPDRDSARTALGDLSAQITREGFPPGTIADTTRPDSVLVPIGDGGYAVYRVARNGTAKLRTVLIAR